MDIKDIVVESFQSLKSNMLRTSLTMLGIVIGISSVILIIGIGRGATSSITSELANFGTNYFTVIAGNISDGSALTGSVQTLTLEDSEAIRTDPSMDNIDDVVPIVLSTTSVSVQRDSERLTVVGTTAGAFDFLNPRLISGRLLTSDDIVGFSKVAIIGKESAEEFFGDQYDPVGEFIRVEGTSVRIIGVIEVDSSFASAFNDAVFMPFPVVQRQILGQDHLHRLTISVKDTDLINQTMADVETLLRDRHNLRPDEDNDFSMQSFDDVLSTLNSVTGLLTALIAAVSGISLVVGGVGVMNIMLVTVTERIREIGLLKAIGARKKDILIQFLTEAIIITTSGGIVGIALGVSGSYAIARLIGIPFVVSVDAIVIAVSVSAAVGVAFGIYPARRASELNPIDALRHE